jgi:hypothetical protein
LQRGLQAVIPAMWVDGEMVAANVTVHNPQVPDDDRIQRMTFPSGTVKTPYFEGLSGAASSPSPTCRYPCATFPCATSWKIESQKPSLARPSL